MPSLLELTTPQPAFSLPALSQPALNQPPALPRQQPLQPLAPPAQQVPADTRGIGEPATTRQLLFDNVLEAARSLPSLENQRHVLQLRDPYYAGPEHYSIAERKKAILEGRTLSRRLRGTWVLRDRNTGQTLDAREMTLANIPYLTDSGTFIHNGSEYTQSSQLRLRPGVFTRVKESGETEAHANILPGKGASHRYFLDPDKGVFYVNVGQAKIPLASLVRALGATDDQLREAWGQELFAVNARQYSDANLNKLYEKLVRKKPVDSPSLQDKIQALRQSVEQMEVDPEVMRRTLGQDVKNLNLDAILAITKKLIAVGRGEAEVDDRDHLAYQTIHGPEDLFAERLSRDYGGLRRTLFNQASWQGNLKRFQPGAFTKQIESALLGSGLGQSLEETNPSDILDKLYRVTRMGEGGIADVSAVPSEARSVQPSHLLMIDPIRTPESLRAGVDLFLTSAVRKGKDGRLYAQFTDAKSGETVWKSPQDVADLAVAFPREMARDSKRVFAMQKGRIRSVPKEQVDLVLPHFEQAFSPLANLIPFKSASKGQRVAMGSRMLTQALPLVEPEAPLVQSGIPGSDKSYAYEYGKQMGALRADKAGRVLAVGQGKITVEYADGSRQDHELFDNFPFNRKTLIHQTPVVQPGDQIQPGQLLARSNYTSADGVTALGKNARVAYLPFRGLNHEDAIVISESFARRLASEHMYQHRSEFSEGGKRSKREFLSLFPSRYNRQQLEMLDDDGAVQPGTEVQYGDPLVLAAAPCATGHHKVLKGKSRAFEDNSLTWKHHAPGVVTDVAKTRNGTTVVVKSLMQTKLADKISNLFGGKGIIGGLIPDDEMPTDSEGRPFEVLLNPLGVISRSNPSQIIETVLGKIAAKTGKPYIVHDFEDIEDLVEFAEQELKKHGLKDLEDVVDPETGRAIKNVLTGNQYFLKLHHLAEDKGQGRATGSYTAEGQPAKGGEHGSKRIGMLDLNGLLAHSVTGVIRDIKNVRGQRNEDFWLAYMQGHTPPQPKVPFVFQKFVNELKAAGVNVVPDGGQLNVMALTEKDIDTLAGDREIKSGETVDFAKGLKPVPGGLFDPALTGAHNGNRWSYVKLAEPFPSPVMEEPIRRLLGLTQQQLEDVIAGRRELKGETGPTAVQQALADIDLPRAIARAQVEVQQGRKTVRDAAVRRLGYLKSAERLGIHPKDWVLTKAPVLPPAFRPISLMADTNVPLVSDANYLYRELIDANNLLKEMKGQIDDVGDERLGVYKAFKQVVGLADTTHPKLVEKNVGGLLKNIFGSSPKYGVLQRKLLSTPVDVVGRAVIAPNPDLDMDSIGLPEERAWDVYKNFVVRRLRRQGLPVTQALQHVEDRTSQARRALLDEIEYRPVLATRAPAWHKYNVMAFWPKLVKGDSLQVSPLILKGFGADFDGDTMQYHVPVSEDAREEAVERMLPSRNLISPADLKTPMFMPAQEFLGGLYEATREPDKTTRPRYFATEDDAVRAYRRGDLGVNDPLIILSK